MTEHHRKNMYEGPYSQSSKQHLNTPSSLLSGPYLYHWFAKAKSLLFVFILMLFLKTFCESGHFVWEEVLGSCLFSMDASPKSEPLLEDRQQVYWAQPSLSHTLPELFPNGHGNDCGHLQIELFSNVNN